MKSVQLRGTSVKMKAAVMQMTLMISVLFRGAHALRWNHPLRQVVDRVNKEGGPYVALVMSYSGEETELLQSGVFVPDTHTPWVDLSGRRFNIGSIGGVDVIYAMSGQRRLNAGVTVQILIDTFDIRGIVHYGIAGSSNDSLSFGDVSILKYVAFTGSWNWKKFESDGGQLDFGKYNFPNRGNNLLGEIEYKPEEFYSHGGQMKEVFWFKINPVWFRIASKLQGQKLQQCVNATYCLPTPPKVVYGLKGSTADVFVDNAAYREFLFNKFGVSTVDEESAAIVMTTTSSKVPCIVIRGVSDLAGGGEGWSSTTLNSLAAVNSLNVAVGFIELLGKTKFNH